MFQLTEMTQATIASVTPRVEKHGDDDVFAISLGLSITGPNTMLDALSPSLVLAGTAAASSTASNAQTADSTSTEQLFRKGRLVHDHLEHCG